MRWTIKQGPVPGQERTRLKFAWLPVKIGRVMVWLERYQVLERYTVYHQNSFPPEWKVVSVSTAAWYP